MVFNKQFYLKIMGLIAFAVLLYVGLENFNVVLNILGYLWKIVAPFVVGCAIAFVLNVPMTAIEKALFHNKKMKKTKFTKMFARPISLILTLLLIVLIVCGVINIIVPELSNTVASLKVQAIEFMPRFENWCKSVLNNNAAQINAVFDSLEEINLESIVDFITNSFTNGASNLFTSTIDVAKGIINVIINTIVAIIFAIYILLQKETLSAQFSKIIIALFKNETQNKIFKVCKLSYSTFANFLTGQCLEAVILGTLFFIVLTVTGLPYALLVGVLIGFTALIPIAGAFIGCVVSAFLILMVSPAQALIFIAIFLVLQQIEGNLIYPNVVGSSVGLPAIWVLVAVTLGGNLMGVIGMLVSIPVFSIFYVLFKEWINKKIKTKNAR